MVDSQNVSSPLKWAGGKRKINHLILDIAKNFNGKFDYYEPFFGGGSIFFSLASNNLIKKAYLNDIVPQIINFYKVLSNESNIEKFIKETKKTEKKFNLLLDDKTLRDEEYYKLRDKFNAEWKIFYKEKDDTKGAISLASKFISLNKLCFNGMFRLNLKGEFNIPIGSHKMVKIINEDNIIDVSKLLKKSHLTCKDYKDTRAFKKELDKYSLIFLDPPYIPNSKTANFTDYSSEGFNFKNHKELSIYFSNLITTKAKVILTNNNNSISQDLFVKGNNVFTYEIEVTKTISADPSKRGKTNELLISNFEIPFLKDKRINL